MEIYEISIYKILLLGSSCKLLSPKVPTLLLETQDAVSTTQKINGFVSTLGDNLSSKNLRLALIVDATVKERPLMTPF